MFLVGFWHSKWKYIILEMSCGPTFLFGLYLNKPFKICWIELNGSLNNIYWLKA
jgi:hypothetical protein